ncbi:MAG: hypothetical protein M1831_003437 [Alyxoria varia]|nr:MAG: hypothetical protein M1831_003437 [Alyxoria varia]
MSPSKVTSLQYDQFYNIIDGEQRSSKSVHHGINPATQEKLWDVPVADQQDLDDAVEAAQRAFKSWKNTPIEERRECLLKFLELWSMAEDQMTDLLATETGKPRQFANIEVKLVTPFAGHNTKLDLPVEVQDFGDRVVKTMYKPLGVCAGICPWNFPLVLSLGKIAPAIERPYTPYTTLKMVELMQQTFPPGVVQVVGGDDKLGPMLTEHPGIAKISFTGSILTGKKIMAACAGTLKRVTLELGGNDASIVLPDVDIAKVAPEVAMGAMQNSGQVCVASKRIYVHSDIYEPFMEAMTNFLKSIKVGSQNEEGVMLGPLQNSMQYEKVKEFYADSKSKGYKFAFGSPDVEASKGYFIQPAVIDNPPNDSRIIQEEPFGPIVPCQPWTDEAEVIDRANKTNAGLGANVWGQDVARAERIAEQLDTGTIWVNSWEKPSPDAFFSGHKESGIGGEFGKLGILSFCNVLVVQTYK